jgi:hypothetical protein
MIPMATDFQFIDVTGEQIDIDTQQALAKAQSLHDVIIKLERAVRAQEKIEEHEMAAQFRSQASKLRRQLRELIERYPLLKRFGFGGGEKGSVKDYQTLPRALVVSALIIAGTILLSVVLATGVDWYAPAMLFLLVAYLVWQHWL